MTVWTVPGVVRRVIDGDTIVCDLDLGWSCWMIGRSVRLAGVNCPELPTAEGIAARTFTESLCALALVTVESHSLDKYGRVLGVVRLGDGRSLADELLRAGHAVVMK